MNFDNVVVLIVMSLGTSRADILCSTAVAVSSHSPRKLSPGQTSYTLLSALSPTDKEPSLSYKAVVFSDQQIFLCRDVV